MIDKAENQAVTMVEWPTFPDSKPASGLALCTIKEKSLMRHHLLTPLLRPFIMIEKSFVVAHSRKLRDVGREYRLEGAVRTSSKYLELMQPGEVICKAGRACP